ncbi:MAG: alanine racemase [Sphingorhabdus sp.]
MTDFEPPLRLILDGEALASNWQALNARSGSAPAGAAVKANGYGIGARDVVTRLRDAGCRDFFVAHWGEAAAIADIILPEWISVLNGIHERDIPRVRALGAVPVLNTPEQVSMWQASGGGRCHIMFDSGINRLGIGPEQMAQCDLRSMDIDLLLSHLASADEDSAQNNAQQLLFQEQMALTGTRRHSLANSAGIMLGADYHYDLTRPGLGLYGGIARPGMEAFIKPVARLSARLLQVRTLAAGTSIGYNATHLCRDVTTVGTISIGYADGYLRAFSSKGNAYHGEVVLPVLGRVSMDLLTIDISAAPELREGDWVDVDYNLPTASALTGLSQYELLTNLGTRFERIWR